jgi:SAM-dependent methyltransferase
MHPIVAEIARQIRLTLRDPARTVRVPRDLIMRRRKGRTMVEDMRIRLAVGERWHTEDATGTTRRSYAGYADYVAHQRSKLGHLDLQDYDVWFRECLRDRLARHPQIARGTAVLCLAARLGTEVRAFQDHGCFAVGIDLNPGLQNDVVLPGDFHHIQFAAGTIDTVYTNSLDHAFEVERMLGEIHRVLKPGGLFLLEAPHGSNEGSQPEFYESFWWNTLDDLAAMVERAGFTCVTRLPIERPFVGESMLFCTSGGAGS